MSSVPANSLLQKETLKEEKKIQRRKPSKPSSLNEVSVISLFSDTIVFAFCPDS